MHCAGSRGLVLRAVRMAGGGGSSWVWVQWCTSFSTNMCLSTKHVATASPVALRGGRQGDGRSNGAEALGRTELEIAIIEPVDREGQGGTGRDKRSARCGLAGRYARCGRRGRRTGWPTVHLTGEGEGQSRQRVAGSRLGRGWDAQGRRRLPLPPPLVSGGRRGRTGSTLAAVAVAVGSSSGSRWSSSSYGPGAPGRRRQRVREWCCVRSAGNGERAR